jgi:aldehyde dehydrogenase (NAD+)
MSPRLDDIQRVFELQRTSKWKLKHSSCAERKERLEHLRKAVLQNEGAILQALICDLRKPAAEAAGEVSSVIADIDDALTHLDEWMKSVVVQPAPHFAGAQARIVYEPRGVCLLFAPWNFPFQLLFEPLVPIIAAGNTAIAKPNELTPATSAVCAKIIRETFDEAQIAVFEGGVDLAEALLSLPVDHVFFTGSPKVGRAVMGAAARHLASVTLELGGKCPVVLDDRTDLKQAAATIAIARCYNAGQVCLCPDVAYVPAARRDEFISHLREAVQSTFYSNGQLNRQAFGKIVDDRNLRRLSGYLEDARSKGAKVAFGGTIEEADRTIHPTVLYDVPADAQVMREEIFGPILPVVAYRDVGEVCASIQGRGKPLALYVFSGSEAFTESILTNTSSGGVTINGWALHWFEPQLPFGGVNESGIGRYHGIHGFRELSHERSVFAAAT